MRFIQGKISPIYIFLALPLSFFLLSFIFEDVNNQWQGFVGEDFVFKEITKAFLFYNLILIVTMVPVYPVWKYYSRNKGFLVNFVVALVYVLFYLFVMYLVFRRGSNLGDYYNQFTNSVIVPLLKLITGVLPLGWFYELFVGTVLPEKIRTRVSV